MTARWFGDEVAVQAAPVAHGAGLRREVWRFQTRNGKLHLVSYRVEVLPTRRHRVWRFRDGWGGFALMGTLTLDQVPLTNEQARAMLDAVAQTWFIEVQGRPTLPTIGSALSALDDLDP